MVTSQWGPQKTLTAHNRPKFRSYGEQSVDCRLISMYDEHWLVKGQAILLETVVSHSIISNLEKQNIGKTLSW